MRSICENCHTKDNCGYLKRNMERDCIDVQTWEDGYEEGMKVAFCKLNCPHLSEYCWQDHTDEPCKEFKKFELETV